MQDNNALAQQLEALAKWATPDTLMNYGEPDVGMRTEPFFGEPLKGNMRPLADWTSHDAELVVKLWNNLPTILAALRQPAPIQRRITNETPIALNRPVFRNPSFFTIKRSGSGLRQP